MKQAVGMQVTQKPLSIHFQHQLESKEILHFLDNLERQLDITSNSLKRPKYKGFKFYNW